MSNDALNPPQFYRDPESSVWKIMQGDISIGEILIYSAEQFEARFASRSTYCASGISLEKFMDELIELLNPNSNSFRFF